MKSKKKKLIVGQNCHSDLHPRWRAALAEHFVIYVTILCINKQRQMSRLESSHQTVFTSNSHLTILTNFIQNI